MTRKLWLGLTAAAVMTAFVLGDLLSDGPVSAQDRSGDLDRAEVEEIVRDYLLENPEVIFEAVERYREKQAALAMAASEEEARIALPELKDGDLGHLIEAPSGDAEIIVVEFFDYNCGFCRQATDFVLSLQEEAPDARIVLQELPVVTNASWEPALAALTLEDTEDYVGFHRALMQSPTKVDGNRALEIARELGLPTAEMEAAMEDGGRFADRLDRSVNLAERMGIDGTPAFIVATPDGRFVRLISGFDEERVLSAIEAAREG